MKRHKKKFTKFKMFKTIHRVQKAVPVLLSLPFFDNFQNLFDTQKRPKRVNISKIEKGENYLENHTIANKV
eukprot:UN10951